jgi:hypothetical protein
MEKYYYAGSWLSGLCQNQTGELIYFPVKKSALALLSLTLFAAGSSTAMSLGRHRGVALVGRPLDISVQAVLEAQDDPAALCIEADAFYADNKLDKSLVRVSTEKALSNPLDTIIRIRSSVPVDEPVVTLYLRVGCQQKTERRYVVLADLVSEPAGLPVLPLAAGVGASLPVPLATAGSSAAGAPVAAPATASSTSPSVAPAASAPARRNRARPAAALASGSSGVADPLAAGQPAAATSPKEGVSTVKRDRQRVSDIGASVRTDRSTVGKARLKLEPLDLSIEHDPQLKSSTDLLSVPAAGEQRSAAAALWRALTAQPQDILRDAEKLQSLENALSTLRAQTQKNQLALTELNSQLEKTRAERYANWLVYALGALLLLALAAVIYFWRQRASLSGSSANDLPWWRKNKPLEKGWAHDLPQSGIPVSPSEFEAEEKKPKTEKRQPSDKKEKKSALSVLGVDLDLGPDESAFTEVRHLSGLGTGDSMLPTPSSLDFAMSMPHIARTVKAEELFDVQQQADFFVSLGQHEQAVDVLRGHILDNAQTSPLVYMDLFNLYHQLDRQADYEALRKDFNQLFTGKIPAFELYTDSSAGLDAYPVALTRIEALWPSPKVLEIIEESILRRPVANADAFDLEAYRELLLLYAVAKEIIHPEGGKERGALRFDLPEVSADDGSARIPRFSPTSIQPLSAIVGESGIKDVEPMLPPPSPRVGLDVDLNDLVGIDDTPPASAQPNPNSNFFARLGTKIPVGPSARSSAAAAPHVPPAGVDNMIDFDEFDASIKDMDQDGHPKV